jgi:hypothetical protein
MESRTAHPRACCDRLMKFDSASEQESPVGPKNERWPCKKLRWSYTADVIIERSFSRDRHNPGLDSLGLGQKLPSYRRAGAIRANQQTPLDSRAVF